MQMSTSAESHAGPGPAIDRTLQYYGFFRYPLTAAEIRRGCEMPCSESDVARYLAARVACGECYELDGYYSHSADLPAMLERRRRGNAKAEREMPKARGCGTLIFRFPFVRFVGISGSLSKGFSDDRSDFDFFIVTARNRLWICRTLLHVFKKLTFIAGRQHDYCMNYFIDEDALTLEEQNIYTATELSTIIPVCGSEVYRKLLDANGWMSQALPNHRCPDPGVIADRDPLMKRIGTSMIDALFPAALNRLLMKLTDIKWRRKWARKGYPAADYPLAFKTTLHVSKNHPANYQKRILQVLGQNDK